VLFRKTACAGGVFERKAWSGGGIDPYS